MAITFEDTDLLKGITGKTVTSAVVTKNIWIDYIHEVTISFDDGTEIKITNHDDAGDTYITVEVT